MTLIDGDRIITAQLYDDEHEEYTEKKMSVIDYINAYTDEGVTEADVVTQTRWIPVSDRLPEYGVAVLTYDGICYCVEKRIQAIRDDNGEPIFGEWWVSDDYDESNSEYYPNLRDGACIAWMPLPKPYRAESEGKE